jgi:regulator of sigma E protease
MNLVWTIAAFLLALGPLIIFHELGHYTVARLCNVKVLRFSIGFGRPLVKWVRGRDRTEWVLALIPFGGYVAMLDERELRDGVPIAPADLPRAFNRQHVLKRIAIVIAGPAANLLLAVLLYAGVNMVGVDEPRALFTTPAAGTMVADAGVSAPFEVVAIDGTPLRSLVDLRWRLLKIGVDHGSTTIAVRDLGANGEHDATRNVILELGRFETKDFEGEFMQKVGLTPYRPRPTIREVIDAQGAAAMAGLRAGDRIVTIDGKPVGDVDNLQRTIAASAGRPLVLTLDRAGRTLEATVVPTPAPGATTGRIGVQLRAQLETVLVRYGPVDALAHGVEQTWDLCTFSLRMIGKMLSGEVSIKNISGPVTIADYAGQSAKLGPLAFISFIAFISISLGVMNLLPIPMLDGGHLLYYSAEIVRGRPPSERFLEWSQRAGMFLLAGLMVVALFNDFVRLLS